ncbi:MAG TPA: hypothetical protein VHU40_03625 [Polyangia bacterium]|nr:hypothetical protein [Polyangia bacterium]
MTFLGHGRWFGLSLAPLVMGASLWLFEPTAAASAAVRDDGAASRPVGQGRNSKKKAKARASKRKTGKRQRRKRSQPGPVAAAAPAVPAVALSPGPQQTAEARKAMDAVRRGQLERAESAARRAELTNRWETVSFLLSGVDDGAYPEAAFWKALASYRRGDLDGGDAIRQGRPLPPADVRALDGERSVAVLLASRDGGVGTGMQPAAFTTARSSQAPAGVRNNAAYTGPAPTRQAPASP